MKFKLKLMALGLLVISFFVITIKILQLAPQQPLHTSKYGLKHYQFEGKTNNPGERPWYTCPNSTKSAKYQPKEISAMKPWTPCPEVSEVFPDIPMRIHQMYISEKIPNTTTEYVKTWLDLHPYYEYWLWTDEDVDQFMKEMYPKYLKMYHSYPLALHKADIARYFILYHFGGFYADLDMECLRPMDELIERRTCILTQEPWPQAVLLYGKTQLVSNAIMGAIPKHLFLEYLINKIPMFEFKGRLQKVTSGSATDLTGPSLVTRVWKEFLKHHKCCYYFPEYSVTIFASELLMPISDTGQAENFKNICRKRMWSKSKVTTVHHSRACQKLASHDWVLDSYTDDAFTVHRWAHLGYATESEKASRVTVSVRTLMTKGRRLYRYSELL